jgi:hypothetical protein
VARTAQLGGFLVLLGLVLLVLVSTPRRFLRRLAHSGFGWRMQRDTDAEATRTVNIGSRSRQIGSRIPVLGAAMARRATRTGRWMLGR